MKLSQRLILTATIVGVLLAPTLLLRAQVNLSQVSDRYGENSKVDLFLGYSYLRSVPTLSSDNRIEWLNGGSASLAYNFTRHFGLAADFGGYDNSKLRLSGAGIAPARMVNADGTVYTYLLGPRFTFGRGNRISPFVQVLFGGIHASAAALSSSSGCTGSGCTPLPMQRAFALTAGGGLDINIARHFAIRLIQAEYLMTRFDSLSSGSSTSQNDVRLSSGILFRFGGHSQLPIRNTESVQAPIVIPMQAAVQQNRPPTIVCIADHSPAITGDWIIITASTNDPDNDPLVYTWSTTGGQIQNTGAVIKLDTRGLITGQYTVTGHVSDRRGGSADCIVEVAVQQPTPLELKLALHSIYFPTGQPTVESPSAGLTESQQQILLALASDFNLYIQTKPNARLTLEGHADPRYTAESNQSLSERRVATTKDFLVKHGVPSANIDTKAFGEEQNMTDAQVKDAVERNPDLSPEDRQKVLDNMATIILASNRRVDVVLSTTGQRSSRRYPFNAADSLTLLNQHEAK